MDALIKEIFTLDSMILDILRETHMHTPSFIDLKQIHSDTETFSKDYLTQEAHTREAPVDIEALKSKLNRFEQPPVKPDDSVHTLVKNYSDGEYDNPKDEEVKRMKKKLDSILSDFSDFKFSEKSNKSHLFEHTKFDTE